MKKNQPNQSQLRTGSFTMKSIAQANNLNLKSHKDYRKAVDIYFKSLKCN